MEALDIAIDTDPIEAEREAPKHEWKVVARDVLVFQLKLAAEGLKDLALAQVALGAALLDLFRRDGSPGRRFYGIVRMSDRFDHWLDLHEATERAPVDTVEFFGLPSEGSVDDWLDQVPGLPSGRS